MMKLRFTNKVPESLEDYVIFTYLYKWENSVFSTSTLLKYDERNLYRKELEWMYGSDLVDTFHNEVQMWELD